MKAHWQYLMYVLRHKKFVYQAGRILGVSRWQLLIHDLSKLSAAEWFPYVAYFYGDQDRPATYKDLHGYARELWFQGVIKTQEEIKAEFDQAWLHHQHVNPHHWQYWLLPEDNGGVKCLRMPYKYTAEMVADWIGAGLALGRPDVWGWYAANKDKQQMHPTTRETVEALLNLYAEKMPA